MIRPTSTRTGDPSALLCRIATVEPMTQAIASRRRGKLIAVQAADDRQRGGDPSFAAALRGRVDEMRLLADIVRGLDHGSGSAVLLEGPAGIGKTRLVEAVLEEAGAAGWATAFATAEPLAVRRPFHLARSLAAGLGGAAGMDRDMDVLLEAVRDRAGAVPLAPPGSARVAVIEAIVEELERQAVAPLVLAIEDLHWADDASLAALRAGLVLVPDLPLALVLSSRADDGRDAAQALREEIGRVGTVLRLEALSGAQAAQLAGDLIGLPIGPRLATAVDRAGGNPFLVTELMRALRTDERLTDDGDRVDIADGVDLDPTAVDLLRVRSLGSGLVELLQPAAVLGTPFSLQEVAAVAGRPAAWFAEAVTEALSTGLLLEDGRQLRFAHDLTRGAIYEDIPDPLRAALHEDAARVLAKAGAAPASIATHAALGAAPGDAVGWLRQAASDVLSLSPADALALLDDALALASADPAVETAIQRARVESLMGVGRLEDAASLGVDLCDRLDSSDERVDLRTRIAGVLVLLNRTDEAVDHLDRAAAEAGQPEQRALAMAQGALARMSMADLDGAAALARDAAALAESSGGIAARTVAGSVLGRLPCFAHGYRDGLAPALVGVAAADGDPSGRAHDYVPWFWAGLIGLDLDDDELVARALAEGRGRADEGYATWAHSLYCGLAASAHHRAGRLDDARAEAETGLSLAVDTGSSQARLWCESLLSLVADLQGDRDERDAFADAAERSWERDNAMLGIDHFALVRSRSGRPGSALEHLAGAWDLFTEMGLLSCQPLLAVPLVRAAAGGEDDQRVVTVVTALAAAARRTQLRGLRALDLHVRGVADGSTDLLVRAAALFGTIDRRLDRAEALADASRLAAASADRRTDELRSVAVAAYEACGAQGAIRALNNDIGGSGHGRSRPPSGWDSLTPTERAIAGLVGEGLTNGEIAVQRHVSRRTVESHLLRVYAKLGHSSRTRLAVEASGRDSGDPRSG